ncbi:MAG TPA: hypothetical protein DIV38_02085 [Clostridiales bacterium]|nr:hypothetical protein [Clostridiales bacterium]
MLHCFVLCRHIAEFFMPPSVVSLCFYRFFAEQKLVKAIARLKIKRRKLVEFAKKRRGLICKRSRRGLINEAYAALRSQNLETVCRNRGFSRYFSRESIICRAIR